MSWFPYAFVNWDAGPDLLLLYRTDKGLFVAYVSAMTYLRRN